MSMYECYSHTPPCHPHSAHLWHVPLSINTWCGEPSHLPRDDPSITGAQDWNICALMRGLAALLTAASGSRSRRPAVAEMCLPHATTITALLREVCVDVAMCSCAIAVQLLLTVCVIIVVIIMGIRNTQNVFLHYSPHTLLHYSHSVKHMRLGQIAGQRTLGSHLQKRCSVCSSPVGANILSLAICPGVDMIRTC
jgi:urease accessory protein UreF